MKTHREREVYRNQNADASLWNNSLSRRKFLRSAGKVTAGVAVVGSGGILQVFANSSGNVTIGYTRDRTNTYSVELLKSDWDNDEEGTLNWALQQLFSSCGNQIINTGPPSLSDYNDLNPSRWSISSEGLEFGAHPTNPNLYVIKWVGPITITKTIRERKPGT